MTTTALTGAVRRAFEELIELDGAERGERLARLGAEDAGLARAVAELLEAAADAPAFLERPAAESELVGHAAGPWILEARLSSGGAGDVYRARRADESAGERGPGWRVAVKVLRTRDGAGAVLRRFEAERRTLAALNHPFIVPLVDAGLLADGRPYLATRLVEGEPLDRFAAGLALEPRLRLFLSVCAAVQHAHERLIAHCDLKPANVLVTREGMPQLLDFGIARLLSEEAAGEPALTPGYASPEQLAGGVLGAQSDVWSLGAVLYELASGRRPLEAPGATRIPPPSEAVLSLRAPHAHAAPCEEPAALARRLRGDFDALARKALADDPSARYATVGELARDLERFLERRPLEARPASRARRALLLARRNRAASAAVLVALVSLALGIAGLYRGLLRSRAEASTGWRAHAQAALAASLLEDLARAAGSESPAALERALDRASHELAREAGTWPETEGRLRIALGALYLEVGRTADAEVNLRRARELAASTRGFGREDLERIERLLAQAQGSQPARSKNQ